MNRGAQTTRRTFLAACLAALAGSGCAGYQIGADTLFRPDIRTVHIPVFESDSFRRGLGERLTEAVIKRVEQVTPYKVSGPDSDSLMLGKVAEMSKRILSENANDEPRNLEVGFYVEVNWTSRTGEPLMQPLAIPLAGGDLNLISTANFIPEAGQSMATGQQEAIDRMANQIVGQMELGL